jgi:hypothetical protein
MTVTKESINARKEVLVKDVNAVRERIAEAQKKITEDQALLSALMGAFQQCEAFEKEFSDETPVEESDVENSEEVDEAIGGTD